MLRNPGKLAAVTFALTITWAPLIRADSPDDGPGRGVARISVINGEVSLQRGDSGDWIAATLNAPLVVQDRVTTAEGSRAEVQFDYANMARLAPGSELRLAELDNNRYLLQLGRGTITFRVLRDQPKADVEISTPSVSVRPVRRGVYRITVQPDGASEITIRSGEADIYTQRGSERIHSGQTMYARGNPADPEFQIVGAIRPDEWDQWNDMRDHDLESSRSYQYVSSDVYGAEELDRNGRWVSTPEYGYVWAPAAAPDWAPYRYGRWVWVDYYGWSWVSYDPWGWAPYHYGRWFYRPAIGWCWWPGGLHTRHYWSPALVAFFGFGHGGGVSVGFGNVGWVPLAPYEPLNRWWGRGYYGGYRNTTFIDNSVHVVNNVNITNVYRNASARNGVTGVSRGAFGHERISNTNIVNVRGDDLRQASLVRGQVPLAPTRESLRFTDREVRADQIRTANDSGKFFSHRQPAQLDRVPFEQQRQGMEQVARRTFGDAGRGTAAGVVNAPASVQGRGDNTWRRMGERQAGGEVRPSEQVQGTTRGQDNGWRRFGDPGPARNVTESYRAPERVAEQPARIEGNGRGNTDNQWRRFGDPGPARDASPTISPRRESGLQRPDAAVVHTAPPAVQHDTNFGRGSRTYEPTRSAPAAPAAPATRYEAPREAIRSAPPVVRERPAEHSGGGGGASRSNSGGGGSHNDGGAKASESRGNRGR